MAPVLKVDATGYLPDRLDEIPRDRLLVVYCQSGARSAIAASVLKSRGFDDVSDLVGGYTAWRTRLYLAAYSGR